MDVYEIVTSRIIETLQQGSIPWACPWKNGEFGVPRNFVSTKAYRGVADKKNSGFSSVEFLLATIALGSFLALLIHWHVEVIAFINDSFAQLIRL